MPGLVTGAADTAENETDRALVLRELTSPWRRQIMPISDRCSLKSGGRAWGDRLLWTGGI